MAEENKDDLRTVGEGEYEGWYYLMNANRWHYFRNDFRALCGRWMAIALNRAELEIGNEDSTENCKACLKKLRAVRARQAKEREKAAAVKPA